MKSMITLALTLFISLSAFANLPVRYTGAQTQQATCDCAKDLLFISEKLEKTPSYKKQITGKKQTQYQATLERLLSESTEPISIRDCFLKLQELSNSIKDKHISIGQLKEVFNSEHYEDQNAIQAFRETDAFKKHPATGKNITEITAQLKAMPFKDVEGIYTYANNKTIGVYKTGDTTYEGIVLSSNDSLWNPGQILLSISAIGDDMYDIVYYGYASRKLYMSKGQLHTPGNLFALHKSAIGPDYSKAPVDMDKWYFEQMSENIQYIRMATFGNSTENKHAFQTFFEETKEHLKAENIIIDLRSNGGGNKKYSDPFIKYIKKSKAHVYVITNIGTGSNSEQFTVKLKNQVSAIQVGQRTNGTIAYGRNYGNSYTTPSGIYSILPTDMNFHNRYFEYEYVGVQPEIQLDNNSDWLEQLKVIIGSKNL